MGQQQATSRARGLVGVAVLAAAVLAAGCQKAAPPAEGKTAVVTPAANPGSTAAPGGTATAAGSEENPAGKPPAEVKPDAPPTPAEVSAWTDKLDGAPLPDRPVSGNLLGQPFQPDAVKLTDKHLVFRQGSRFGSYREVRVAVPRAGSLKPGAELTAAPGQGDDSPQLAVETHEEGASTPDGLLLTEGFLKLALKEAAGGKVAGQVYLGTAEEGKGWLAGAFTADDVRPDPAAAVIGEQDVPCLYGRIQVSGTGDGPVGAEYAGVNDKGDVRWGGIALPLKGDEVRASNPSFKPRISQLETAKDRTGTFHHCQVEPGQYLVHASWNGQPAAWQWVEVKPGGRTRVDLAFEAGKTGKLEVTVPVGANDETLRVVPADPDGQVPIPENAVWQIALPEAMVKKAAAKEKNAKGEVVAVFEGLPPGPYRVFAGRGQVRTKVEAGGTAKAEVR